ncbi:UNVERIFIED_CONTAM: hypothetical protein RMT77_016405 [Armadillidium vulgare]
MRSKIMSLIAFVSLFIHLAISYTSGVLDFEDILPEDPSSYDKMRPPKKEGKPTVVYFHVTVMSIDSINENSMTYAADIFFAQTWKDHRLRLPENMTSDYRLLEVEWLQKMWRPDSFFKNAKQVTFQTMTIPNHYVWLYKSKSILYMVKLTLTLSCAMNYAIYPHDVQECKLQMESLSHTTEDLIFEWDPDVPLVVDTNIELPQFDLVNNRTADCSQTYSTGNFTCLEVVFLLRRRLGYYLFHTYMPTCLIVIMSWISFWIKPEAAPARVTLGVTSLLTLSTQHAKSQASLPPVSYIKIIDMFMSTCTVFVFLALMEYALVNVLLGDGYEGRTPKNKNKDDQQADSKRFYFPNILVNFMRRYKEIKSGRTQTLQTLEIPLSSTSFQTDSTLNQINLKFSSPRSVKSVSCPLMEDSHPTDRSSLYSLHHEAPLTSCIAEAELRHSSYSAHQEMYPHRQSLLVSSPSCRHEECLLNYSTNTGVHHCRESRLCEFHAQHHPLSLCDAHSHPHEHIPSNYSICSHAPHSHNCHHHHHCTHHIERKSSFSRCNSFCSSHGDIHIVEHEPLQIRNSSPQCTVEGHSRSCGKHTRNKRNNPDDSSLERRSRSVERSVDRKMSRSKRHSSNSSENLVDNRSKRSISSKETLYKDKDIQTEDWDDKGSQLQQHRDEASTSETTHIIQEDQTPSTVLTVPSPPPPPPPPSCKQSNTHAQKRRARAIMVDRFSRVFFPSTFGLMNAVYWIIFWIYL